MALYHVYAQDQSLVAATPQTLWQIRTASTRRVKIREFGISLGGTNATDVPVKCELIRYTNNGTGNTFTPLRWNQADPAALSSAATAFSGEPTASELLMPFRLTPNGGVLVMQYAPDTCPHVPVSSWVGFRCTAPAAVQATAYVIFEE